MSHPAIPMQPHANEAAITSWPGQIKVAFHLAAILKQTNKQKIPEIIQNKSESFH